MPTFFLMRQTSICFHQRRPFSPKKICPIRQNCPNVIFPVRVKSRSQYVVSLSYFKASSHIKLQTPTRLLKLGAQELVPGLTMFCQLSLDQGKLPTDWKTANVSPVFKKGNRLSPVNYRSISLTSVSCKILEYVIHSSCLILKHMTF